MRHWRWPRSVVHPLMILCIAGFLVVIGCDDDVDLGSYREATAQDFAVNGFSFRASFLAANFMEQRVTLEFGTATENMVPFTMRFSDVLTTVLTGTATVPPLQLRIDTIVVDGMAVAATSIRNVPFTVGTIAFTLQAEIRGDGDIFEFRFTNPQTGETLLLNNL